MSDTNRDSVPPPPPPLPPDYAAAPPVVGVMGYATRVQESSWPKVVGIIGIVLATLGILGGVCGLASSACTSNLQVTMQSTTLSSGQSAQPAMPFVTEMGRYRAYTVVAGLVGAALQVILLVASINLMKRRPWTIDVLRIWAGLYIVVSLVGTVVSYHMTKDMLQQISTAAGPQGQFPVSMSQTFMGVGMVFGIAWSCALPVFILIWFARDKIKAETATWL